MKAHSESGWHRLAISSASLLVLVALSSVRAGATDFAAGLGTVAGKLEDPAAAGETAAREAMKALKGQEAKAVLLFTALPMKKDMPEVSYPDAAKVVEGVCRVFPTERVFGCDFYQVLASGGSGNASVAVLALGGDKLQAKVAHAPCFHWMGGFEKPEDTHGLEIGRKWERILGLKGEQKGARSKMLRDVGRSIASGLGEVNKANSLLLLIGDMHVDSNAKVMAGVQEVLGEDFPIVGGASPPEYACYVAGEMKPAHAMGVLLSMPMRAAAVLDQTDKAKSKDWTDEQWIEAGTAPLKKVLEATGGTASVVFMFDCQSRVAGARRYLPKVLEMLTPGTALFGFQGSGENGPKQPDEKSIGTSSAVVYCGVAPVAAGP
jgi:hypothetical protein